MGWFKRLAMRFGFIKEKARILFVGLDNSGKSTIVSYLKPKKATVVTEVVPTVGFQLEDFTKGNISFTVFDMSGQGRYRNLWEHWYKETQAIVFVIDSADRIRLVVAKSELDEMLGHEDIRSRSIPVLFFANKQDIPGCMDPVQITEELALDKIEKDGTNALMGRGIEEGSYTLPHMPPSPGRVYGEPSRQKAVLAKSRLEENDAAISDGGSFAVWPPKVVFKDVEPATEYRQAVKVRNIGSLSRRMRVLGPQLSYFKLEELTQMSAPLAPGMYTSFEIVFYWPDSNLRDDQTATVVIAAEADSMVLQVSACVPAPDVVVPPIVDIGDVITQNSAVQVIDIENKGSLSGKFRIEYDQRLPLSVTPQVGQVEANSKAALKFELRGKDAGPFEAEVRVLAFPGLTLPISVRARVVEQRLALVCGSDVINGDKNIQLEVAPNDDDDEQTDEAELLRIDFGTLYYGQERQVHAKLVNRGPHLSTYVVDNPADHEIATPSSHRVGAGTPLPEESEDVNASPVTILPFEGKLGPFQSEGMTFTFSPRTQEKRAGFVSRTDEEDEGQEFDYTVVIDVVETEQKLNIVIYGRAVKPVFAVSKTVFHFGDCPSGDHREIEFQITNGCPELPVPFVFTQTAQFHVKPTKGHLSAGSNKKIVASFAPNQLGRFNAKMNLLFGAPPIVTQSLSLYGSSLKAGAKKRLVGGVGAVPSDFHKQNIVVDETSPTLVSSITPRAMVREKEQTRMKQQLFETPTALVDAAFRLGPEAAMYRVEERAKYEGFLKESRYVREERRRRKAHTSQLDYENNVDIGIVPGSELEEPEPDLPVAVDPLWLEREPPRGGGEGRSRRQHRRMRNLDALAAHLAKKRYKPTPTTPAEVRECVQSLSPSQLVSVTSGTKNIDFGEVCVFSEHVKSFVCINDLRQHVIVELRHESPELDGSGPLSQVIPPGGVAGFDIVFSSPVVQNFIAHMTYTINGIHSYKLNAAAQVVPTQIDLSTAVLEFSFLDSDLEMSTSELLQLRNPGTYPAQFKWDVPKDSPFVPDIVEGTVEAGRTLTTHISFTPGTVHINEATLVLLVHGGMEMPLKCIGNLVETRCTFQDKSVDFGVVPVGLSKDMIVVLRNPSTADAVFAWDQTRNTGIDNITTTPARGRVPASGSTEITLSLTPPKPGVVSGSVLFHVRGGKQLRLSVHAEAAIPQVTLEPESVDFGAVYVGVSEEQTLKVYNQGTIMAQICVNFDNVEHSDDDSLPASSQFSILPPRQTVQTSASTRNLHGGTPRPTTPLITPLLPSMSVMSGGAGFKDFIGTPRPRERVEGEEEEEEEEDDAPPTAWVLTVQPGSSLDFLLIYKPTDIGSYDFSLPVHVTGANEAELSTPRIKSKAKRAPLLVSDRTIDFGTRVVMRGPSGQRGHYASLIITSNSQITVSWRLDLDDVGSTFKFEPSSGVLDPLQRATIRVAFSPQSEGIFEKRVPLLHNDEPYLKLEVKGVCTHPRLSFDRREVVLPPVPVGFLTQGVFGVVNQGYDSIDVKCRLKAEASNVPLTFSFPNGTSLGFNHPKIPCVVSFRSRKPLSFTAPVEFFDMDGNKYTINVTGVCDNSMLTLYPFLRLHPDSYEYVQGKQGRAGMLIEPAWAREAQQMPAGNNRRSSVKTPSEKSVVPPTLSLLPMASPGPRDAFEASVAPYDEAVMASARKSEGTQEASPAPSTLARGIVPGGATGKIDAFSDRVATAVVSFVNAYALRNTVDNVQSFSSQSGRLLIEVLETLSGKTNIVKTVPRASDHRDHRIVATLKMLSEALDFLRGHGALLGPVRPEYLLKFDEFRRLIKLKGVGAIGAGSGAGASQSIQNATRKRLESLFPELSRQAWIVVLIQAIRVFALGKIRLSTLRHTPGVDKALARDEKGLETNMYSSSEALLMKWLGYHYHKATNEHRRVANFHNDLKDGVVLLGVIQSHTGVTGSLSGRHSGEFSDDETPRSRRGTVTSTAADAPERLVRVMQELGLDFRLGPSDLTEGDPIVLELLAIFLFHTLPQYLPRAVLNYVPRLGQRVERQIELENSTTRAIQYLATLNGATEFMFQDGQTHIDVLVEAKSKRALPVICLAKLLRPANAKLILIPQRRPGTLPAEPLVFSIVSTPPGGPTAASSMASVAHESLAEKPADAATASESPAQMSVSSARQHQLSQDEVFAMTPSSIVEVEGRAYEIEIFDTEVTAPAKDRDVTYRVTMYQDLSLDPYGRTWGEKQTEPDKGKRPRKSGGRFGGKKKPNETEYEKTVRLAAMESAGPVFAPHNEEVTIPAGGSGTLTLSFIPVFFGRNRVRAVLTHANEDIIIELRGLTKSPLPVSDTLRYVCEANRPQTRETVVPMRNVLLEKMRDALVDRANRDRKTDGGGRRAEDGRRLRARLAHVTNAAASALEAAGSSPGGVVYHVEMLGKFFSGPSDVQLVRVGSDKGGRANGLTQATTIHELNAFPVTLTPRGAGTYNGRAVFRSPLDIRIYDLEARAVAQGMRATLEFHCAARQVISQEIPFENPSEASATLRCQLTGKYFTGPRELMIPGGASTMYQLVFRPLVPGSCDGELVMSNDRTGERSVFTLVGNADEPLAEDHVVITCTARAKTSHKFTLPSSVSTSGDFDVICDLPFVSGPSSYKSGMQPYVLDIAPLQAGVFCGAVSFLSKDKQTIWYTLEMKVEPPSPEREIDVKTVQRVPVAVAVSLSNPVDDAVVFNVVIEGDDVVDPELIAPATLELGPKETVTFELYYLAVLPHDWDAVLRFISDSAGEFWYQLHLSATPAAPIPLRRMTCEVGSKSTQAITIENPLENDIVLHASCSNERNFHVVPEDVALPSLGTASVLIEYTPSCMGGKEKAEISLSHANVGAFVYTVEGTGKPPTRMQSREIVCALGSIATGQILFRNPFPNSLHLQIDAVSWAVREPSKHGEGIKLLTGSDGTAEVDVGPFADIEVPFSFKPTMLSEYASTITLRDISGDLAWPFPVVGVVEAPPSSSDTSAILSCRSRTSAETVITMMLHHAPPLPLDAEHATPALSTSRESKFFHYETMSQDSDVQAMIAGCLDVSLISVEPDAQTRLPVLSFSVTFAPLRPVSGACELIVRRRGVGQWRRNITLRASEPEVDDIIRIETMLGHTGSISFKLKNMFESPASFKAFFTSSSPAEFTVVPPDGTLPPSTSEEDAVFIVSYTPVQYGKQLSGQLVILTDEVQWTYDVRGQHPEYKSPGRGNMTTSVDSRLRPEVLSNLSKFKRSEKKRFVSQNIRSIRRGKR